MDEFCCDYCSCAADIAVDGCFVVGDGAGDGEGARCPRENTFHATKVRVPKTLKVKFVLLQVV